MKKMKVLLKSSMLLVWMMIFVLSCKTTKRQLVKTISIKDSISVKMESIDTMLILREVDTARISVLLNQLTEKPIIYQSEHSTAILKKNGDSIEVECIAEQLEKEIELLQKTIAYYKTISEKEQEKIFVPEPYIPWYYKPFFWIGAILSALWVGKRILNRIKPKL